MRRLQIAAIAILITLPSVAQYNNPFSSGRDRLALIFSWNTWLNNADTSLKLEGQSRGFDAHWMFDFLFEEKSRFSVGLGAGIGTSNVFYKSMIGTDTTGTIFTPYHDSINVTKNKLATAYAEAPLELRYRTKPDKNNNSFKIALGIKVGLLISASTKYVGEGAPFGIETPEAKIKTYRIPNMNKLRYGATFRVGYANFNLVAFYALSTLFEPNLGPTLNPFSVGISFTLL